jgi:hypothetical protein
MRHRGGLGAAAAYLHGVVGVQAGEAERVRRLIVHRTTGSSPVAGSRGEPGLEGVHGMEGDDGIHRAPLAFRASVGRRAVRRRQLRAEVGEGLAVVGAGEVGGLGVHDGPWFVVRSGKVGVRQSDVNSYHQSLYADPAQLLGKRMVPGTVGEGWGNPGGKPLVNAGQRGSL